ncbi:MAG: DUF2169 domain-containing protein [Myxococcota bacterium]
MIIKNNTPFIPMLFKGRDQKQSDFWVFVLRGSFRIVPNGRLRPTQEQHAIVAADEYDGEPNQSSLRRASDLVPLKPRADIHIHATAHAPNGQAHRRWRVSAKIGSLVKFLTVTGARYWRHSSLGGWALSEPEPCIEVPLRYELAFGGVWADGDTEQTCRKNPIGLGFVASGHVDSSLEIPAPQIEDPSDPVTSLGSTHVPQGVGPIPGSWQPRLMRAGTFDQRWIDERHPELPLDFDFAFYNSAHPDLIYPGILQGEEAVQLDGLIPGGGRLAFELPGYRFGLKYRYGDGGAALSPILLDTLSIDVPNAQAHLVWRHTFPTDREIDALEVEMAFPFEAADA